MIAMMPLGIADAQMKESCTCSVSVSPTEIVPGEPVDAKVCSNIPLQAATYVWSSSCCTVVPSGGDTAQVFPNAEGYDIHVLIKDRTGKYSDAQCSASGQVKGIPVVSCTPNPVSIRPGETVEIAATATVPDGEIDGFTFHASQGTIVGTGSKVKLQTSTTTPKGVVEITVIAVDNRGLTGHYVCQVTVR
jgi:hypothetical protein